MPTQQRAQCESEIYHLIQRGTGQLDIFEDDKDRMALANLLKEAFGDGVVVLAWCFMSNHVHLLVRGSIGVISEAMRAAFSQYVQRFNWRHQRSGVLFQSRFKSIPVKSDAQLLTVVRYIHRNPVAGKLCEECGQYAWSSFSQYVECEPPAARDAGIDPRRLRIDARLVLGMLGGEDAFLRLHEGWGYPGVCDIRACSPCSEDEHRELAAEVLGGMAVDAVGKLPREERDDQLRALKRAGFGIRLIQRLTGISYNAIRKA